MTIKVREIMSKLQVLKDILMRKDKSSREEADAEQQHIWFLERNLTQISIVVERMRAAKQGTSIRDGRRDSSPFRGQTSLIKSASRGGSTSLKANRNRHRHMLSSDWKDYRSSRNGSEERNFTSTIENMQLGLKPEKSTLTLQNAVTNKSNRYLNNIYHKIYRTTNFNDVSSPTNLRDSRVVRQTHKAYENLEGLISPSKPRMSDLNCDTKLGHCKSSNAYAYNDQATPISAFSVKYQEQQLLILENPTPTATKHVKTGSYSIDAKLTSMQGLYPYDKVSQNRQDDCNIQELAAALIKKNPDRMKDKSMNNDAGLRKTEDDISKDGLVLHQPGLKIKRRDNLDEVSIVFKTNSKNKASELGVQSQNSDVQSLNRGVTRASLLQPQKCIPIHDTKQKVGSDKKKTAKLINDLRLKRNKYIVDVQTQQVLQDEPISASKPISDQHLYTLQLPINRKNRLLSDIESMRHDDTNHGKDEGDESEKKTERKSSPGYLGLDMFDQSPVMAGKSHDIAIKEMSKYSDFTSQSNAEFSMCTDQ